MFKKFFKNLGRKAIESELDSLIEKFSKASNQELYILHTAAKSTPGTWKLLFNEEAATFCDNLLHVERSALTEETKKEIALLGQQFTSAQRESNEEFTKFGFWFWRVVFLSMIHPELEEKGKHLGRIIVEQSDRYISELTNDSEAITGEEAENTDSLRDETLAAVYPLIYK
jgi:hypothetical protein